MCSVSCLCQKREKTVLGHIVEALRASIEEKKVSFAA